MASGQCSDCEGLVRFGSTRCLPCENLRFKEKPEFSPISSVELDRIKESVFEIAENGKALEAESKKAQLDSAFASGGAIGEQEASEDYHYKSLPDSYCSECGAKLSSGSNFCAICGKKRNATHLSDSISHQSLYTKRKKSKSSVWLGLLILLVLVGVGYGVYGNVLPNDSSNNNPQDYDVTSVEGGVDDDSGSWERVCKTVRNQEDWAPGELTDAVLNGSGGPRSSTTEVCEDVWVP
jgi:hypothetical protein